MKGFIKKILSGPYIDGIIEEYRTLKDCTDTTSQKKMQRLERKLYGVKKFLERRTVSPGENMDISYGIGDQMRLYPDDPTVKMYKKIISVLPPSREEMQMLAYAIYSGRTH